MSMFHVGSLFLLLSITVVVTLLSVSFCICRVLNAPELSSTSVGLHGARNWIRREDIHLRQSRTHQ